jgi:hypothetical protein
MKVKLYLFILLFFFGLNVTFVFSQNGTIKGFVYEKSNGEPIPYCTIYLINENTGAVTDDNGYFALTKLKEGNYRIKISYIGYDSLLTDITLKKGEIVNKKFYLERAVISIEGVEIIAQKEVQQTETYVAVQRVSPKQISQLPSIGGIPDIAQYLQVLPGVVFTGDQGGQLYIRGGTPIQNKVLLDGLVVYNPFHSIGLFSVFDTDIIKSVDVYSAGFGAEYGGRISSILDIKSRDGNRKRIAGKFDVNTFGAKMLLEGPLLKEKNNAKENNMSFLLSVKGSYLEQTSKFLYKYANADGLPYNYLDGYGKISLQTNNGSRVNFFGFSFNDGVNYPDIANYKWNSWGAGANFIIIPGMSNMLMDGTLAYSDYKIGLTETTMPERISHINGYSFNMNFTYLLNKNSLKYGIEFLGTWLDYEFTNPYGTDCGQQSFNSEFAIYFKYKWMVKKFIIEPSFRLHYYASQSFFSPEPRIALKYNINKNIRVKLAAGIYTQNLMSASSDQDVVNLFYGLLTVPEFFPESFNNKPIRNSLQKSQHLVFGWEFDISKYININVEGYFKNFSQLTNINRYQMFASDDEFILETGKAYGADVGVRFDYKKINCAATYSLNWVNRNDGIIIYRTHFDRRHNINVTASYTFGKNDSWQVDARWNFGTGFPFTKTKGLYPKIDPTDNINTDINGNNEAIGIIYDKINGGQLPDYHRLDINMKRKFKLSHTALIELNLGVTNAYNYYNIFYINRKTNEKIYQLPFLWSLSVTVIF